MTRTHSVNLMITTRCQRLCPACNVNTPTARRWDIDEAEIRRIGPLLGRVDYICLTGGEPLMHPDFDRIAKAAAECLQYGQLVLATNATFLMDHLAVIPLFQMLSVTHYMADSYPGSTDNGEAIEAFRPHCPPGTLLVARDIRHRMAPPPNRKGRCDKLRTTASLQEGRIYPCCVSCGLDGAPSAPLTPTWREDIQALTPPCAICRSGPD